MDYFKVHFGFISMSKGKWLEDVSEYGLLFGKNKVAGKKEILAGIFQYYNFIDNSICDLSTMAFGGGVLSRLPIYNNTNILMDLHLGIIPFGGVSTQFGLDTSQFRDYNYGGGMESKINCAVDISKVLLAEVESNYYWLHSYNGLEGNYITAIIAPRIIFRLFKNTEIGLEYLIYYNNKFEYGVPALHYKNSEEKFFLSYHLACCEK